MEKIITIPKVEAPEGFKSKVVVYLGRCVEPVLELTHELAEQQAERQTRSSKSELILDLSE